MKFGAGALLNLYRNGKDSISWHSDDESMLKLLSPIASLSFGSERVFKMRHKTGAHPTMHMVLKSGSLLIMGGKCQKFWLHAVEKDTDVTEPRINITLREYQFKKTN
jgi:alkylated DNA repair dioxygenase AlkB